MRQIKRKIATFLKNIPIIDAEKDFVFFERLWSNTKKLRDFSDLIVEDLLEINKEYNYLPRSTRDFAILTPDTVEGRLGTLPLCFFVSEKLKTNVIVWKENANIKTGSSRFIGNLDNIKSVLLLQDIVEQGTTILKIKLAMRRLDVKWSLSIHYAVIHGGRQINTSPQSILDDEIFNFMISEEFRNEFSRIKYYYGVHIRDIRNK